MFNLHGLGILIRSQQQQQQKYRNDEKGVLKENARNEDHEHYRINGINLQVVDQKRTSIHETPVAVG